jgi:hypothetical protein
MRTLRQNGHREIYKVRENSSALFVVCILILIVVLPVWTRETGAGAQSAFADETRWAILVAGISGDPGLQKEYLQELVDLRGLLEGPLGFPRSHLFVLFDKQELDPGRIQYQSTRENLENVCKEIAGRASKEDLVFVFLEGHGGFDGNTYKLNLAGPDPTGEDLAAMFYAIPAQRFVVINATNCSGGSLEALSGKGRIVISATRSGNEKNLTHLGKYFVEALANNNADVDKNGRVSIFEAFSYAARKVEEYYSKEGIMQTEHPMLSDNGDEHALTLAETVDRRSTLLSRSAYLDRGNPLLAAGDMSPESQALAKEAQSLEKQIELLKSAKDEMSQEEYEKRLEALLLRLAEVQARLRKK